ncbi:MAG: OmpA family protein [Bacteroides sp.]|nr:OmpA family protein [Bacteroides sp.]MCM1378693.1 OmpA family protein [Bacteroides sp.]MCM1444966.1 OmpA family protein [Prevotella sp.]
MKLNAVITYIIGCAVMLPFAASAKTDFAKYHQEIIELSVDDNLLTPDVPSKLAPSARTMMATLSNRIERAGMKTDLSEREGMVLMVTVPTADLFNANDTLLSKIAPNKLKVLANPLLTPDKYKLLIVVHSDDTGSEEYLNNLTRARADAIRRWFAEQAIPVDGIVPYGLGYDEPISSEQSRKGRAANRRVEFYYVPGPVMIEELKTGRR